jgi:hypothetical protein
MLRKLGPRNESGSGSTFLLLSVNWFSTINNAGAPSAGTSSTTDLKPALIRFAALHCAHRPRSAQRCHLEVDQDGRK